MFRHRLLSIAALALGLYLIWTLVPSILEDLNKGQKITHLEQKLEAVRLENERLQLELSYLQSRDFVERQARDKLNLSYPKDTLVILPQIPKSQLSLDDQDRAEENIPNWQKWLKLFWY